MVPLAGGPPREVDGFTAVRFPVWSPDGQSLLVLGSRAAVPLAETYDWWIVPLGSGSAVPLNAYQSLRERGLDVVATNEWYASPEAWIDGRIFFSDQSHLWNAALTGSRLVSVEPLAYGPGTQLHFTRARTGAIAFSKVESSVSVWRLPLDVARGTVTGVPVALTSGQGTDTRASPTRDGRLFAYNSFIPTFATLVKNLDTGEMVDVGSRGSSFGPALSPDGTTVAYNGRDAGNVYTVPVRGGAPQMVCEGCGVGDWGSDSRTLTAEAGQGREGRLVLIDVVRRTMRDLIVPTARTPNRPELSVDNHMLAFRAGMDSPRGQAAVFIARVHPDRAAGESEWTRVTPAELDVRPCGWSPDGRQLYFVSSRDGNRCLYAQKIDPDSCRPVGDATAVQHFHGVRNVRAGGVGVLSTSPTNAIVRDGFIYDLPSNTSNVWMMTPRRAIQ